MPIRAFLSSSGREWQGRQRSCYCDMRVAHIESTQFLQFRSKIHQLQFQIMDSSLYKSLPDLFKLEALDGTNYKRWAQKLLIFFEQLEVDYVLTTDCPQRPATVAADAAAITSNIDKQIAKYEKHNKFVRGHLLSHMTNALFDLFINNKSAKSVWETLEKKYGTDDAGKKKYAAGKWLQFKIVDDKPIMDQVHEYENLVANILAEGMKTCEVLQANVLIEKLHDSWSNCRNHLKHKK